ncbi:serine/threonine-protein kinase [Streptomyces sp. HUAS ZL42]|uniref:serine/threonine-protein kinase n=1 Tax=Streptomyces sp. HUAS ZL42 TaxID=3231715 RepID=UPI00345E12DE
MANVQSAGNEVRVRVLVAERYRLDGPLGQGSMGEVWRATDQMLGRPVAVKLLRTGATEGDGAERFRREARIAARLNHPHVVAVYDFGGYGDQHYLVMELVDGWTLRQELHAHGTLDPYDAAVLGAQVAEGLAAAHHAGVIHRDIKPANVMLTAERDVKITDFGIARFADETTSTLSATGKIVGTGDYLAPERALGQPAVPASDLYSLGCMLYHLLTGRPPFLGRTTLEVVQQQVSATPVPPTELRPDIPRHLADCVLRLLAKDPAHRPTAEQTTDLLVPSQRPPHPGPPDGTVPPAATGAAAPPPVKPVDGSRKRRKAILGAGAVVLFGAAAGVGVALNSGGTASHPSPTGSVTSPSTPTDPAAPGSGTASATSSSEPSSSPTAGHKARGKDDGKDDGKKRRR